MTRCLVIDHSHNERGNQPLLFPLTLLGLTCTFRASCCSTRLSWAHTPAINWVICLAQLVVTLLQVSEREEGAVALHLPIGPLKPSLDWNEGHMVKDHSDSERGNQLPLHRLLFPISSKCSFICNIPQTG